MGAKISVNLDQSSLDFLDSETDNRSAYINGLIREKRKIAFEQKLEADYEEQSNDPEWQAEIRLWDSTIGDGLDDSIDGMTKYE